MPLSSMQIAQMSGAYQQQALQQMEYSSTIGQNLPTFGGERIMGGAASTVGALASPVGYGGLALAGLDPVSIGLTTGMNAYGRMGLMGAAGAGLAAGGAATAGLMGVSYMGEQFMQGMQQQQALNQQLRNNFRFVNRQGGYGFTAGGAGQIGQFMHQQSMNMADTGQMTTFEELGRLAQGMARMGMAQGVRDAKDFTDRFKKMLNSVKEIAKEMGTSLEEAQKVMGGLRQVGIFQPGQAVGAARAIRQGAAAGGLATSEVTGMMNVGSQLSRMIGGRGGAGAVAGANAITNLGVAQQLGIISEEDIYESTGLTGAEGRAAWAQQRLQGTAQFLRSNFGRRLVASMAGRRGELDPASVARFMAGGVGTGETMRMAHEGVRRAGGPAGYMRYEGRMRGELMRQFGADLPVMAVRGWLEERNLLVNDMRDRDMLGLQKVLRRGGVRVGQAELEQMVRQARSLPQIMAERQRAGEEQQWAEDISRKRGTRGVEGLKRKLEQARANIQGRLQQAGSEFYQEGSEIIERFINRLTDTYVQDRRRDVEDAFRAIGRGGGSAEQLATFGMRRGAGGRLERINYGLGMTQAYNARGDVGARNLEEFRRRDLEGYQEAGWGGLFQGMGRWANISMMSPKDVQQRRGDVRDMIEILRGNRGLGDVTVGAVSGQLGESMKDFLAAGTQARGLQRVGDLQKWLSQQGTAEATQLAKQLADAPNAKQRIATTKAIMNKVGITWEDEQEYYKEPEEMGIYNASRFFTEGARIEDMGRVWAAERIRGATAAGGAEAASYIARARTREGAIFGLGGKWGTAEFRERAEKGAAFARTEEGRKLLSRSTNPEQAAKVRGELRERLRKAITAERQETDIWGGQKITGEAGGEVFALRRMMLATHFADMVGQDEDLNLDKLSTAQRKDLVKRAEDLGFFKVGGKGRQFMKNLTAEEKEALVMQELGATMALGAGASEEARQQANQDWARSIGERLDESVKAGVLKSERGQLILSDTYKRSLTTSLGDDASAAERYMETLTQQQVAMKRHLSAPTDETFAEYTQISDDLNAQLAGKSVKQLRAISQGLVMGGRGMAAARVSERASFQKAFGVKRGRDTEKERISRFASTLGMDLSRKEVGKFLGAEGDREGLINMMAQQLGLNTDEQKKMLAEAVRGLGAGGQAGVGMAAEVAQKFRESGPVKKMLEDRQKQQTERRAEDYKPMGLAIANALMSQLRETTLKVKEEGGLFG